MKTSFFLSDAISRSLGLSKAQRIALMFAIEDEEKRNSRKREKLSSEKSHFARIAETPKYRLPFPVAVRNGDGLLHFVVWIDDKNDALDFWKFGKPCPCKIQAQKSELKRHENGSIMAVFRGVVSECNGRKELIGREFEFWSSNTHSVLQCVGNISQCVEVLELT